MKRESPQSWRFEIRADHTNSILRLRVWGFWTVDEAKAYWSDFQAKARTLLSKPWYVLANVADFPPQKDEVNELVGQTMNFAKMNGMVRAANLINQSALAQMLITRLSTDTKLADFAFFSSEAEAVAWLLRGS